MEFEGAISRYSIKLFVIALDKDGCCSEAGSQGGDHHPEYRQGGCRSPGYRTHPWLDAANSFDDSIAGSTYNNRMDAKRMGKKQELMRSLGTLLIAFALRVMGTWKLFLAANIAGRSASFFWFFLWAYAAQAFIIPPLAKMASIAPTASGQYHWVSGI